MCFSVCLLIRVIISSFPCVYTHTFLSYTLLTLETNDEFSIIHKTPGLVTARPILFFFFFPLSFLILKWSLHPALGLNSHEIMSHTVYPAWSVLMGVLTPSCHWGCFSAVVGSKRRANISHIGHYICASVSRLLPSSIESAKDVYLVHSYKKGIKTFTSR